MLNALKEGGFLLPLVSEVARAAVRHRQSIPDTRTYSEVLDLAKNGYLRDRARCRPETRCKRDWYSSWQLLDLYSLRHLIHRAEHGGSFDDEAKVVRFSIEGAPDPVDGQRRRDRAVALAALAMPYLPVIAGYARGYSRSQVDELEALVSGYDGATALRQCGINPADLYKLAEGLLFDAHHSDPLAEWQELVDVIPGRQLDKLRGTAYMAVQQRRAAEVLLRCYVELGYQLPDHTTSPVWHPLDRRLSGTRGGQRGKAAVLGRFGISTNPRVVILGEGVTEFVHLQALLRSMGIPPDLVRVEHQDGADTDVHLLARHVVAPRVGRVSSYGDEYEAPPTLLRILADPEGHWAPGKTTLAAIKQKVMERTKLDGVELTIDELDNLVQAEILSAGYYEIANFTDDELLNALTEHALERGFPDAGSEAWLANSRTNLQEAKTRSTAFGKHFLHPNGPTPRVSKRDLAERLTPVLEADMQRGAEAQRPIVRSLRRIVSEALQMPDAGTWIFMASARTPGPP